MALLGVTGVTAVAGVSVVSGVTGVAGVAGVSGAGGVSEVIGVTGVTGDGCRMGPRGAMARVWVVKWCADDPLTGRTASRRERTGIDRDPVRCRLDTVRYRSISTSVSV